MDFVKLTELDGEDLYINVEDIKKFKSTKVVEKLNSEPKIVTQLTDSSDWPHMIKEPVRIVASKIKDVDRDSMIVTQYFTEGQMLEISTELVKRTLNETQGMYEEKEIVKLIKQAQEILRDYTSHLINEQDRDS